MPGAVIDHAPLGGKRNLPLLLVLGLLHKAAIAEDLQIDQPPADRRAPEQKHRAQQVKPGILARIGVIGHDYPSTLSFRDYPNAFVIPTMREAQRRNLLSASAGTQQVPRRIRS